MCSERILEAYGGARDVEVIGVRDNEIKSLEHYGGEVCGVNSGSIRVGILVVVSR